MKKRILSLVLSIVMVLSLFTGLTFTASAADMVVYTLAPAAGSNNGYAGNCDVTISGIQWNITGNSTTIPWRIGGKSLTGVDRAVYSKTAMSSAITKVELDVGTSSVTSVNSLQLVVASDAEFTQNVDTVTQTFAASSTITFTPTSGNPWTTGSYYKFIFNVTVSGDSNKYVQFVSAKFYADGPDNCEHTNASEVAAVAATCTTAGSSAYYYCSDCMKYFTDNTFATETTLAGAAIAALGHDWTEWTVTTPATCTTAGEQTRSCQRTDCEATETEAIAKLGHTDANEDGICDTCLEAMPTPQYFEKVSTAPASFAGEYLLVYAAAESTDAKVFNGLSATDAYVAATIADGKILKTDDMASLTIAAMEGGYSIMVNGENNNGKYISGSTTANAMSFGDAAVANTLTYADGNVTILSGGYLRWNASSNLFRYYKTDSQTPVQLYKLVNNCEHNWVPGEIVLPTCTEAGYTPYTCSLCNEIKNDDTVAALGHNLAWDGNVGADGVHTLACSRCEFTSTEACTYVEGACSVCGAAEPASEFTVTFSVPTGLTAPEAITGSEITLPAIPDADGYDIAGWGTAAIDGSTTDETAVLAVGATYAPTEDTVLYAVYSTTEGNPGGYILSGAAPTAGDKVIIAALDGTAYKALWVSGTTVTANDITVANNKVTSANAASLAWTAANGSYSGNSGLGMSNGTAPLHFNSSAIKCATGYQNGLFTFTAVAETLGYTMYSYNGRYLTYGSNFGVNASAGATIYFFIYAEGDQVITYYTEFEAQAHVCADNLTEVTAIPATCTEAGNTAYYTCSCGKFFSDAAAETEIADGSWVIAALGHDYGEATCNDDGTHSQTCSRCPDVKVSNCADSGVLTEAGGNEFECSVCGYTWTVEQFGKTTSIANGDRIVIYNPNSGKMLGSAASGSKLAAITVPTDYYATTTILIPDGAAVMTVADFADGQFHLTIASGDDTLYLTSGATGNSLSFAAAPAEGATDYALWTIDTTTGIVIKSVNAVYNSKVQALEYYNGFTTYSTNTTAAYQMEIFSDNVTCAHTNTELTGAVAATCLLPGYTGDTVCADCGETVTAGSTIAALGHSFTDGTCANCGATQLTAVNVTSLTDGETVYIYNASAGLALTAVSSEAGKFVGVPGAVEGTVLTTSSDAALLTVRVVEGGYKFEDANGNFLTYGDDRNTLSFAADSDKAIWAIDAGYHMIDVNSGYTYNDEAADLYLEAYNGVFTTYATSSLTDAFVLSFYDPAASVCEHVWDEGVATTPATCVDAGVMTYTCTLCGATKTEVIAATGVHTYVDGECTVCGAIDPASIDLSGNYYIAGTKSTGEIYYMSAQGTASYRQADEQADLAAMPASIDADVNAYYVWTLTKDANGTYTINATYGTDKYIGWSSGNYAPFVTAANAKALTVTQANGITHINFVVDPEADTIVTRHFSFNPGSPRFAFYANTSQRIDLVLIPVTAEPAAHEHSYAWDGNVGADGFHTLVCANSDGLCDALTTTEACTYVEGVCSVCGAAEPVTETHTATYQAAIPADCSTQTDGFVGYWYCAECLNDADGAHYGKMYSDEQLTTEIALADAAVAWAHTWVTDETVLPTCTEDGYTAVHCSVCSATDMINIVDNLGGHIWRAATAADGEDAYLAATCTEDGMYVDICDRCGALGSEIYEIPAIGHDCIYTNNGDDHTVTCSRCDYNVTEAHTFVEGVCVCGAEEVVDHVDNNLTFATVNLQLESYIGADFFFLKTKVASYDSYFVRFTYPTASGDVTEDLPVEEYSKYFFAEHTVAAKEMSDTIQATIYATVDGVTYHGPTTEWTLKNAMRTKFDGAKSTEADKALCVAILNYGAKAQARFSYNVDDLATSVLTAEEIATYLPAARAAQSVDATTSNGLTGVTFYKMALSAGSVTVLNVMFAKAAATDISDVECRISYTDRSGVAQVEVIDSFTASGSRYVALFNKLTAKQLGDTISITFYSKTSGQAISETRTYSEESYIALNPSANEAQTALYTALIQYADAAAAKFA